MDCIDLVQYRIHQWDHVNMLRSALFSLGAQLLKYRA